MNPLLLQALVAMLRTPSGRINERLLADRLRVSREVAANVLGELHLREWVGRSGMWDGSWYLLTRRGEAAAWWVGAREHLSLTRSERARLDAEMGVPS